MTSNCLPGPVPALLDVDAQALELLPLVAAAHARVESASAQDVYRGKLLGHLYRVAEGQHHDGEADSRVLRPSGDVPREREQAGQYPVAREMVFAKPDLVEPGLVRELRPLQHLQERLLLGPFLVPPHRKENAEFHWTSLPPGAALREWSGRLSIRDATTNGDAPQAAP